MRSSSTGRVRLLTIAVVVGTVLATVGPDVAEAWPAPRYECYCRNCYGGRFVCRSRDYSCNCTACSCYNDVHDAAHTPKPRHKNGNINSNSNNNNNNTA